MHLYQALWINLNISNTAASKRRIPAKCFLSVPPSLPPSLKQPEPEPRQKAFDDQIRDTIVVSAASFLSFLLFNTLQQGASSCQSGVAIPDRQRDLRRCCCCQAEEGCLLFFSLCFSECLSHFLLPSLSFQAEGSLWASRLIWALYTTVAKFAVTDSFLLWILLEPVLWFKL